MGALLGLSRRRLHPTRRHSDHFPECSTPVEPIRLENGRIDPGDSQAALAEAINTVVRGEDTSYLHDDHAKQPVPVRLELSEGAKSDLDTLGGIRVRSRSGTLVPLGEVAQFSTATRDPAIHHKDLLRVVYVVGGK